jgi:hypothetical protein
MMDVIDERPPEISRAGSTGVDGPMTDCSNANKYFRCIGARKLPSKRAGTVELR